MFVVIRPAALLLLGTSTDGFHSYSKWLDKAVQPARPQSPGGIHNWLTPHSAPPQQEKGGARCLSGGYHTPCLLTIQWWATVVLHSPLPRLLRQQLLPQPTPLLLSETYKTTPSLHKWRTLAVRSACSIPDLLTMPSATVALHPLLQLLLRQQLPQQPTAPMLPGT